MRKTKLSEIRPDAGKPSGRQARPPQPTWPYERVTAEARILGKWHSWLGIELARGESAWNPASTSRLLYGPSLVEYSITNDGISGVEYDVSPQCHGFDFTYDPPTWTACSAARLPGTTRCADHLPGVAPEHA